MDDLESLIKDADARQLAIITIFARQVVRGKREPGK